MAIPRTVPVIVTFLLVLAGALFALQFGFFKRAPVYGWQASQQETFSTVPAGGGKEWVFRANEHFKLAYRSTGPINLTLTGTSTCNRFNTISGELECTAPVQAAPAQDTLIITDGRPYHGAADILGAKLMNQSAVIARDLVPNTVSITIFKCACIDHCDANSRNAPLYFDVCAQAK